MIEKIPDQIHVQTGEFRGTTFDIIPKETFAMACRKINELVDAVNELTSCVSQLGVEFYRPNPSRKCAIKGGDNE